MLLCQCMQHHCLVLVLSCMILMCCAQAGLLMYPIFCQRSHAASGLTQQARRPPAYNHGSNGIPRLQAAIGGRVNGVDNILHALSERMRSSRCAMDHATCPQAHLLLVCSTCHTASLSAFLMMYFQLSAVNSLPK